MRSDRGTSHTAVRRLRPVCLCVCREILACVRLRSLKVVVLRTRLFIDEVSRVSSKPTNRQRSITNMIIVIRHDMCPHHRVKRLCSKWCIKDTWVQGKPAMMGSGLSFMSQMLDNPVFNLLMPSPDNVSEGHYAFRLSFYHVCFSVCPDRYCYDTIRYGRLVCAPKLTRWPA